jgi:general secretion pathway protein A
MYNEFFGFREKPFNVTPDPRFFYANSAYEEAYASLVYGIQERKGFVTLIGEVGTGKTTLLRRLMTNLALPNEFVYLCYSTPSFEEFLTFICSDLGMEVEGKGYLGKIQALNNFLLSVLQKGGTGILLVDEAQNLGEAVLENLRLLSNIETATEKLLQIVLVGQPELEKKLARPNLRQLKQRIAVQCRLDRLKEREVGPFIFSRLRTSGYEKKDLFPPETIQRIALYSRGTPRLVNIICDNALLLAYSASLLVISPAMVDEVARDLQLRSESATREDMRVRLPVWQESEGNSQEKVQGLNSNREFFPEPIVGQRAEKLPFPPQPQVLPPLQQQGTFFRVSIGALLAFLLLPALGVKPESVMETLQGALYFWQRLGNRVVIEQNPSDEKNSEIARRLPKTPSSASRAPEPVPPTNPPAALAGQSPPSIQDKEPDANVGEPREELWKAEEPPLVPATQLSVGENQRKQNPFVIVQSGTTVSEIVRKNYKSLNILAIDLVKEFNPHVADLDHIQVGEKIWLPPLTRETLLRQETDGSYHLVLASFRSLVEAERFSQKVRMQGYRTKILPQRVSRKILLQRVEIEQLEGQDIINQAWELVNVRDAFDAYSATD